MINICIDVDKLKKCVRRQASINRSQFIFNKAFMGTVSLSLIALYIQEQRLVKLEQEVQNLQE